MKRLLEKRFSLNGFGQGLTTGGGIIAENDPNYVKVYNAVDLAKALVSGSNVKVIEIMNDLNLGYNEIPQEAKEKIGSKNSPFREHITPIRSNILIASGVSKIVIDSTIEGLTIFSSKGRKIKHASFIFQGSKNIVIRNLEFDELWEWDDSSSARKPGSDGDYDRNDWDYLSFEGAQNIWVDHCTFHKAYDGMIDAKKGTENLTISWCVFTGDDLGEDSWVRKQVNQLELDTRPDIEPPLVPMYYFLRFVIGLTKEQIMQVAASHKKCHLIGATELAADNALLSLTLNNNIYKGIQDRIPRLRAGNAHIYNILVDNKELQEQKSIITSQMNQEISARGYHFGVTSNCCISTENGALLVEKSRLIDITNPVRNNQKSGNPANFTGKVLLDEIIFSMTGKLFGGKEEYFGNSLDSNGPLYPKPATVIPFSWNNISNLPYEYTALEANEVEDDLTKHNHPGSGKRDWSVENWLRTQY